MDIILVHLGSSQPPFMKVCIEQAKHFSRGRVIEEYEPIDLVGKTERFANTQYLTEFGMQGFWLYAALRLFAVEAAMKKSGLKKCLHIENDNLIYDDPENTMMAEYCGDSVGLTQLTETELSAGVMYVGGLDALAMITEKMTDLVGLGVNELKKRYGDGMYHEMRLLKIIHDEYPGIIKLLPTLPGGNAHVFDPASWGQWVGGTFQEPGKRYAGEHHLVGRELLKGKYNVAWIDKVPWARWTLQEMFADRKRKIFNLHIHSKELEKWKSYE